ncbi:malectin domain-containing carbohydrate-binding protein [Wenyingzhuangia marina]|uniref:malectin domain-containing carbohydrate-binding protein n=1 Tax=Wenyingzhuangia marina TaxID=1195760 RepID=UPI001E295B3B|nr:malectin domain-containing carbohydrate-binding protein [Wenyingzhuangia marina]
MSNKKSPMVYIVSHSWPNRWTKPGIKNSIDVYSNCDEVELFNDVNQESLGKLKNPGLGEHFQWKNINVKYNVLYAVGYVNGKAVAKDYILLNSLPESKRFNDLMAETNEVLQPQEDYNYIYRVNSGGDDYVDTYGNTWMADVHKTDKNTWGSKSWTDEFKDLPTFYASQRTTYDPIKGTQDWKLFQDFRYGGNQLKYEFPVPDGEYLVELYFNEPWYGTGGGMDCTDWRVFDVAINDKVVLENVDVWKEVGHDKALKKTVRANVKGGVLKISFPNVTSSQAIISAIAIATKNTAIKPVKASSKNILNTSANVPVEVRSWLNITDKQYIDSEIHYTKLPAEVYGADYVRFSKSINQAKISGTFISKENATVYVFVKDSESKLSWLKSYEKLEEIAENNQEIVFKVFKKEVKKGEKIHFKNNDGIAVVPLYNMDEKDDRPIIKLEAEEATLLGKGIKKAFFKKSDYVEFTQKTTNKITFEVAPGVANIYLMRFRFMNMNDYPVKVNLSITDANGISVRNDVIEFPIKNKKWKVLNTSTGGFINAGTYKITLEAKDMKGLRLESFEFQ